jgi:4'-phosphopantetheinyl transferase
MDFASKWPPAPVNLGIESHEVHVWRAAVHVAPHVFARMFSTLSDDEHSRAKRFLHPLDRDRFVVGRGIQRDVLSRYAGLTPENLVFQYSQCGKPRLASSLHASGIRFNGSNSDDVVVLAIALGREVGVDVETFRPLDDATSIIDRFFSTHERNALHKVARGQHAISFFQCWTRKEAYIKAVGGGLSIPLDSFDVAFGPGEPARLLAVRGCPEEVERWDMLDLQLGDRYVAALVVQGRRWRLKCFQWTPSPSRQA